jgi:hypothetical protein
VRERSAEINELITVDVPSDLQRVSHVIVDEVHERSVDSGMWCGTVREYVGWLLIGAVATRLFVTITAPNYTSQQNAQGGSNECHCRGAAV